MSMPPDEYIAAHSTYDRERELALNTALAARQNAEQALADEQLAHADTRAERDAVASAFERHMAEAHGDVPEEPEEPEPDPDPEPDPNPDETVAQQSIAVRVFPQYANKNYGDHNRVLDLLGQGAWKRVSGLLTPNISPAVVDFYRRAYELHGIKAWFTVGKPRAVLNASQWDDIEGLITGPLAGIVELMSGWNEPNHVRGGGSLPSNWAAMTANHQDELWSRAHPHGISVGTPQLWSGNFATHDRDLAELAPLIAGAFDTTAWHLYPRATVGGDLVERFDNVCRDLLGPHPVVCTEAGYSTGGTNGNPVSEAEQAELWPAHCQVYLDRGYRLSVFELLDDPAGGREGTLGIVRDNWTPKPAFHTLRDLLTA